MKQTLLFDLQDGEEDKKYTGKIEAPIYEPKNKKPHILELYDKTKYSRLRNEIENSNLSQDEKQFLIMAATRHIVFNYENIADYYAHASKEAQNLMERSALVIIDFQQAIELGYIKLSEEIKNQYLKEYESE